MRFSHVLNSPVLWQWLLLPGYGKSTELWCAVILHLKEVLAELEKVQSDENDQ